MIVIQNLISKSLEDEIESTMKGENFSWFYNSHTSDPSECSYKDSRIIEVPQFTHVMYRNGKENSNFYSLVAPIVYALEKQSKQLWAQKLFKIKANLLYGRPNFPADSFNMPHRDLKGGKTLLYYVNSSDGNTQFFNETYRLEIAQSITPEKGKSVLFDSDILHASTPPRTNEIRLVLNILFNS